MNRVLLGMLLLIAGAVAGAAGMAVAAEGSAADGAGGSHADRIAVYEGTKTCLRCHEKQARDVHGSVHYQWKGDTIDIVNDIPNPAGKYGGINDFCIYPDINWIGKLTNVDGKLVDSGCAKCHAGLGAKPTRQVTRAQLENIDCLVCHSSSYRRKVEKVGTTFKFVPDATAMTVSLLRAARSVTLPTKDTCLNCHSKSGGGDNYKRGDIEEAHRNADRSFDVHMASRAKGGAGLNCTDCHATVQHRIAGRGVDLRSRDLMEPVTCTNCHSATPHGDERLDRHTARVNCTVCHIPAFARRAATDMVRDWSKPGEVDPVKRLYDPHMVKRTNVVPVYRFFNGQSRIYHFGDQAIPNRTTGRVMMAAPVGSVKDPTAKIHAFKHHLATQPVDPVTPRLLPLKIGIFFATGNLARAVDQGVKDVGWPDHGFRFARSERYMGIFHEVAPKENALSCSDCHGGTRMNFRTLGYTPKAERNGEPLCASCHERKRASFSKIHDKHVKDEGLDCITCHSFSAAR